MSWWIGAPRERFSDPKEQARLRASRFGRVAMPILEGNHKPPAKPRVRAKAKPKVKELCGYRWVDQRVTGDSKSCPKCQTAKPWQRKRGCLRCRSCRHEWNPNTTTKRSCHNHSCVRVHKSSSKCECKCGATTSNGLGSGF